MVHTDSLHVEWVRPPRENQTPIVFIHGFLGSSKDFVDIASQVNRPSLLVDLPGHGKSPPFATEGPWFDKTIQRLEQALGQQGVSKVDIVGYSLGGRIAMSFAHQHPNRVRRLVLESCHPGLHETSEQKARLDHDAVWANRFLNEWPSVLQDWYEQPIFNSNKLFRTALVASRIKQNPLHLSRAMMGFSLGHQPRIDHLDQPVLFISGELDAKYENIGRRWKAHHKNIGREWKAHHENLGRSTPLFFHQSVEGAGHNVHLEQPGAYLSHINHFINLDPL